MTGGVSQCVRVRVLTLSFLLADLVAAVGMLSTKVDATRAIVDSTAALVSVAANPPSLKRISNAAKTDVNRAFARNRLQAVTQRFGTLLTGMVARDKARRAVLSFDWAPYRAVAGGGEAEERASPALLTHFANLLQPLASVHVEDARQLELMFSLPPDSTVQHRIDYRGKADALVTSGRAIPGYAPAAATTALLVVDWKSRTKFVDGNQLNQQRAQMHMEMLALYRSTGRYVSGVLTDLSSGMRVWDVVGSVIVEWAGSAVNGALTLGEGFGVLNRILQREIAVTDALFEQALRTVAEGGSGSDDSDDEAPPPGTGWEGGSSGGAAGREGSAGEGGAPPPGTGSHSSARAGAGENARGGLQDSEAALQAEYDAAKARGRFDARVRAIDRQIRRSPFAQLLFNA